MFRIHQMNTYNFDLNLLRVLDALLRERNVSRAAERLSLSQPAVSNALARLRELLARISHSPAHWAVLTDAGRRRWRRLPTALISGKRLRARLNKALAAGWTGCDVEGDGGCAAVSAPRRSRHRRRDRTPPAAGRPNSWPL